MAVLFAAGIISSAAAADKVSHPTGTAPKWFEEVLIGMEVGPTGPQSSEGPKDMVYASRFDGREIMQRSVDAGSQYMVIWGRDGDYTYYNSSIQPKAPALGDRDVLQETIEVAREHGQPVIVYVVLQYPAHALRTHPEWKMKKSDGSPIDYLVCFNSPYRDHVTGILAEIMEYDIDGFHLDMVDQGFGPPHGCWCNHCEQRYREEHGQPMPRAAKSWDADWDRILDFRYRTSQRFEEDLVRFIRSARPELTVDFNYHGNPPFSWEVGQLPVIHANTADFVTGETGLWGFSALGVGLNAQFYRGATPGKPYQVAIQRGVRMYHDQTTRPLADMQWELFTLLAHGAFVTMIDKTAFDGSLDAVAWTRFGQLFDEVHHKAGFFGHQPVYDAAIYFSARTRDWYGRDEPSRYFRSFQGAHRAMVYDHQMFGVLHSGNLSLETMKQFPVIVLPNAAILDPHTELPVFRQYVREGGNLLITGQTGQFDRMGAPLAESTMEELIGARLVRQLDTADNWVSFDIPGGSSLHALAGNIPADWPFLNWGPASVYRPVTATAVGTLYPPHRSEQHKLGRGNPEWPMSPDTSKPAGPAMLINRIEGGGTVLTLASSPDYSCATDHYITEARRLLTNSIRHLHPIPMVRIDAPANVESVITRDAENRRFLVHFIASNSLPQTTPAKNRPYVLPGLTETAPLYRASIRLNAPASSAAAHAQNTQLKFTPHQIDLTIERIHEVIEIRY